MSDPNRPAPLFCSSPVPVECGLVLARRVQRLVGVYGHRCPHALVGALQRLVVGREDVQAAGHPGRGEVGEVLAALLLLVDLPLVAVPPRVPALGTAGEREAGWGRAGARPAAPSPGPGHSVSCLMVTPSPFPEINHNPAISSFLLNLNFRCGLSHGQSWKGKKG